MARNKRPSDRSVRAPFVSPPSEFDRCARPPGRPGPVNVRGRQARRRQIARSAAKTRQQDGTGRPGEPSALNNQRPMAYSLYCPCAQTKLDPGAGGAATAPPVARQARRPARRPVRAPDTMRARLMGSRCARLIALGGRRARAPPPRPTANHAPRPSPRPTTRCSPTWWPRTYSSCCASRAGWPAGAHTPTWARTPQPASSRTCCSYSRPRCSGPACSSTLRKCRLGPPGATLRAPD